MEKCHNALAADGESINNTSKLTIINKSTYSLGSNNFKKGAIFIPSISKKHTKKNNCKAHEFPFHDLSSDF